MLVEIRTWDAFVVSGGLSSSYEFAISSAERDKIRPVGNDKSSLLLILAQFLSWVGAT